jgi:hypothetical protein
LVFKDVLRVLYAPHKVFKDIIQDPKYWGPFVLLLIFVLAQVGSSYVVASRSYLETSVPQTVPLSAQGDLWTENAAFWKANEGVTVRNNTVDYINSTYATTSIEFAASNASNVWMELNSLDGSVNCGADGFKNVSLRVKQVAPDVQPENASIYLYSLNSSNFYYDLTQPFSSRDVNVWNNITLTVGSGDWLSSSADATWENITGLKMEFTWPSNSSITLRIDGLFFRGNFQDPFELYGSTYLISSALNAMAPFLFEWLLLTGLMYLLIKALKGNVVWKPLMVAVGFVLITIVIQYSIIAVVYTSLPSLFYPLEVLAGTPGEFEVAYQVILDEIASVNMVSYTLQLVVWMWTIALGTFIVRAITSDKKIAEQVSMGKTALDTTISGEVTGFSWMKCLLVSGASFFLTIIILGLLLGI